MHLCSGNGMSFHRSREQLERPPLAGCWAFIPKTDDGSWLDIQQKDRLSTCQREVKASWESIQALTPDATQMGGWAPTPVSPKIQEQYKHPAACSLLPRQSRFQSSSSCAFPSFSLL